MKELHISNKEQGVIMILREMGVDIVEVMELGREALRIGRGSVNVARKCLKLGEEELRRSGRTVTFERAVEAALEQKRERRARTLVDFRYTMRRFMKRCPGLAKRRVRAVQPAECAQWIEQAFDTPAQRKKARVALSGVFAEACRRGWCADNPLRHVPAPRVEEKRIEILSEDEIERLLHTAAHYRGGVCLPAVGLMLYAGIRPQEVARLRWEDVCIEQGVVCIQPRHSKTGGMRQVRIHPPLEQLLRATVADGHVGICPPNWRRRWAELRRAAGWLPGATPWQADVLRHTFATHHLLTFRSYDELQVEMGHRSSTLLRTRYVNMPGSKRSIFEKDEVRGSKYEVAELEQE